MFRKITYIFFVVSCFTWGAQAQEQRDLNKEVKVSSAYQPKINKAKRLGELPEIVDTLKFSPSFEYFIQTKPLAVGFSPALIHAAKMIGEPLQQLNGHNLTLAGGNYANIYGDYRFNNKRSKELDFGVHLHHYSMGGDVKLDDNRKSEPDWSEQLAEVYGTKYLSTASVSARLFYDRKAYSYYGLPLATDDGKTWNNLTNYDSQQTNRIGLEANYATNFKDENKLNYGLGLKYENFSDDIDAKDNDIHLNGFARVRRGDGFWSVNTNLNYFMSDGLLDENLQDKTNRNSFVGTLLPSYLLQNGKLNLQVGLKAVFAFGDDSETQVYPNVNVDFEMIEDILNLYVGLDGDLKMNQYKDLIAENPYVISGLNLAPTNEKYKIYAGVKGSLSSKSSFNVSASYSAIDDQYFFAQMPQLVNQNQVDYSNKFIVLSDDIALVRFMADLDVAEFEKLNVYTKFIYNYYSLDKQAEAWHCPNVELSIEGKYQLLKDLSVSANLNVLGERYALRNQVKESLGVVYNLSFGASYALHDNFTAFAKVNNIFADRYYQWDQYPSQRLNFLIGLKTVF